MEVILNALTSIWDMLNEMSPYLLLGFLIAGLMHAFVPARLFNKYLSGNSFRSVLNAALLGIPLPLCSCGVIPTAMSLRKEGASKGAAVSFLIATPQTGVDSILASYSLLGLPFAIIRPIAALFTALFGGQMVNRVNKRPLPNHSSALRAKRHPSGCRAPEGGRYNENENNSANSVNSCKKEDQNEDGFGKKLVSALRYAYLEMMEDIGKWLVIGIVIAGLISLIPNEYFALFKDNTFASILLVLVLAVPMYLCATGSIPIAVALMLKGLTPGAALVMLMAGPASNMASIMVIGKVLGRRTLITYLSSIISGAILFALLIDFVLPAEWFMPTMMMGGDCCHESSSLFGTVCSILLIAMLVNALLLHKDNCHCHDDHCHCHDDHDHDDHCHDDHCHCHENGNSSENSCENENENFLKVKVKGMNCSHCAASVKKAIEGVEGVESVEVVLSEGMAYIKGNPDLRLVKKEIESIGFTTE